MTKKDIINSPNITETEILELKKLFPKFFSEWAFDVEWFKEYINGQTVNDKEFYRFEWTWKQESKMIANKPSKNTLLPDEANSKNWDKTENIFIEWDNLEVLKLLQNKYFGQIKMIYIDPPYNKDKDFVYKDTWKDSLEDYLLQTGQVDEDGETTTEKETTWRKHSNWLNMIYPRLILARRLLKEDWVIFVSIDDDEVHNLRKIMDEVFGEDNFLAEFAWRKTDNQANIWNIAKVKEYIVCYSKNKESISMNKMQLTERAKKEYRYSDENWNFRRAILLHKTRWRNYYEIKTPSWKILNWPWMISEEKFYELDENNWIYWTRWWDEQPYWKIYLSESWWQISSDWLGIEFWTNQEWSLEVEELFDWKRLFDFPKSVSLIRHFLTIWSSENDIILDFFAWSWTTAHAVMELNKEDEWNRKFIWVQLPEKTDKNSIANKEWYEFISQITRERIKRAGEKIKAEWWENVDIWFRAFKLGESNFTYMSEKYEIDENTDMDQLELQMQREIEESWLRDGRTQNDIIYEIIIREWYSFNSKIEMQENWIYKVIDWNDNFFYFIAETKTDEELKKFIKSNLVASEKKNINLFVLEEKLNESQRVTLSSYFKLVNL